MQRHIFLAAFVVISAPLMLQHTQGNESASSQSSSALENEIKDAIRQRLDALRRGDAKAYLTFFADDCLITSDNGSFVKPGQIAKDWLDTTGHGVIYKGSDPLDVRVHFYGDIAVATFRLELDEDWSGQKLLGASRLTNVFAKREGRWLLVADQETPVPHARRQAAQVDPSNFDAYAGEYRLTPTYIVKVKREGNKLMDQWPGDATYVEDVPVSASTFVVRGEPGESIYVKDEAGKVTHFISRTPSGDLIAQKIN
jgi:uncharacterized protein (TIGR02246 family)